MERACRFAIHLIAWVASLGVAVAACAGVYFLSINNLEVRPEFAFFHMIFYTEHELWSVHYEECREAELLLLPEHTNSAGPKELLCKACPTGVYGKSVGYEGSELISCLSPAAACLSPWSA